MKTKEEIVENWLPRYTGEKLENFGQYILLTNFSNYVNMFAKWNNVEIVGVGKPMECATLLTSEWEVQLPPLLWIYFLP